MEATFTCSICGESSHDICEYCTKDTCENHICSRCRRCSDCCECEFRAQDDNDRLVAVAETAQKNGTFNTGEHLTVREDHHDPSDPGCVVPN